MTILPAVVKCSHCKWSETVQHGGPEREVRQYWNGTRWVDSKYQPENSGLAALLKSAWSIGLEHAWDNRGHVVETFVDGHLKATQQIADMSAWKDHRSLIVEEGLE